MLQNIPSPTQRLSPNPRNTLFQFLYILKHNRRFDNAQWPADVIVLCGKPFGFASTTSRITWTSELLFSRVYSLDSVY